MAFVRIIIGDLCALAAPMLFVTAIVAWSTPDPVKPHQTHIARAR